MNTYHHSIRKKPLMLIILLCLKNLIRSIKLLNLKLVIESGLLIIRLFLAKAVFLAKVVTKNWSKEIFVIDSMLKTNP